MRLLFVTPFYHPEHKFGGPPRKIHSLASGLVGRGHEVRVVTFHSERPAGVERISIDGVDVDYLPWVGRGLKQWPKKLARIDDAVDWAELVHCYGIYNFLCPLAARAARKRGKPFVLETLGMYPARTGRALAKRLYNRMVTRSMASNAAALVATSEAEVRDLETLASKQKIVYRRNGVDVERFQTLPSGDDLRSRWGIKAEEKIVLSIGRLSPIKNLEQFIIAFGRANVANTRLVLVGPGEPDYEKQLHAVVTHEKLGSRVIFAGPLYDDDQKAALGLADLFVLPSINESFGNAAGEAVAADVPVILTDTCGVAPLIDGRAGIAVPLGVDSLVQGLRRMLNPAVRDQMTARREEVKRELSWDKPIRQTEELYAGVLNQGGH
jgi:glycosyltransferase involved in cell wall biosynthesis